MNSSKNKLAIITGASSGIGLEFAFILAEQSNYDLVLVARRIDNLAKIANEIKKRNSSKIVHFFKHDLSSKEERDSLWKNIKSLDQDISLLVNNAGFGSFGFFYELKLENELKMLELNCSAIVDLSHKALEMMIPQNHGAIINVSSMASFQGLPCLATYSSTKSFVTSFSLALSEEVKKYDIKIQALCPGPVATEFGQVAGFKDKISLTTSISAREVVESSLSALSKSKVICIPGKANFFLSQLNRFIPNALASKLAFYVINNKYSNNNPG